MDSVITYYVILTVEYGRNENIHITTSDNQLYFVMRREASNDKIQWIIGYIVCLGASRLRIPARVW